MSKRISEKCKITKACKGVPVLTYLDKPCCQKDWDDMCDGKLVKKGRYWGKRE